jgi:hypothetical protein
MNKNRKREFYFPLFRLIATLRGGSAARAESNAVEAWLTGLMVYLIHYLFFAALLIPSNHIAWQTALLLVAVAFWVWLFWLLFLYLNSVIIRVLHLGGLFRAIPTRRLQSILWIILTTAMAWTLLKSSPAPREAGAIWLVTVAMNLAAAVVLAFSDGARVPGE